MTTPYMIQPHQRHWDWRAAGNFICGGAGAGLLLFVLIAAPQVPHAFGLHMVGLGLIGLGLLCVWLEIGRPLRAVNVFVHLRRSWMSREALAALVLFALGAGLLVGMHWRAWPTAAAAAAFLYCQARIVGAARAIPAWCAPLTPSLLVVTALAEGAGLFWLLSAFFDVPRGLLAPFGFLLILRAGLWYAWRLQLQVTAPRAALRAVDRNGRWFQWGGHAAPLVLLAWAAAGVAAGREPILLALAGLLALAAGSAFKFNLITRAGYQRGFALPQMPVRGVPHVAAKN